MAQAMFTGELDYSAVRLWAATLADNPDEEVHIDLDGVSFARPSGMAPLAAWMESLLRRQKVVTVSAKQSRCFEYMQNMNLFKLFSIYEAEGFNRQPQAGRFARMARIDWQSDATKIARDFCNCLQVEDTLVRSELFTCLEESMMNLWAHAAESGFAVAQSYERGTAQCWYELAIVDCGKGIRDGLLENPDYKGMVADDAAALQFACHRGVTGARYRDPNDQQHFGMGLFSIDQIAQSAPGTFRLCSGSACRTREGAGLQTTPAPCWQGTMVLLQLTREGLARRSAIAPDVGGLRFG